MFSLFPVLRSDTDLSLDRTENLFDRWLSNFFSPTSSTVFPAFDINETDNSFILSGELAGVKPEDVNITLEEGVLTIKGEKKKETEDKESNYSERSYGSFQRSWSLGSKIDIDSIDATFKDGVLKVTLPKTSKTKGKKVEIKTD